MLFVPRKNVQPTYMDVLILCTVKQCGSVICGNALRVELPLDNKHLPLLLLFRKQGKISKLHSVSISQ